MATKRHGRWTPSLHPRGKGGKFSSSGGSSSSTARVARREGGKAASAADARKRRVGYAKVGARTGLGVANGAAAIVIGVKTGSHGRTAAGVARIGLAGAHATHSTKKLRRETSRDFKSMSHKDRLAEASKTRKRSLGYAAASGAADYGLLMSHAVHVDNKIAARNHAKLKGNLAGMSNRTRASVDRLEESIRKSERMSDQVRDVLKKIDDAERQIKRSNGIKKSLEHSNHSIINQTPMVNDPFTAVAVRAGVKVKPNKPGVPRTMPPDFERPIKIRNSPAERRRRKKKR